jgi:ABC-type dipeptide/oligopeptide/nickel transport system permease subunit
MDIFLAFPLLVFALALAGVIPDDAFGLKGDELKIAVIVFIIGFFNWPYIGRIIRGQTLSPCASGSSSMRRAVWAPGSTYILFKELLPTCSRRSWSTQPC